MLEEALAYLLLSDAGVAGQAGNRVFPLVVPAGTALPALAYQRVSGPRLYSHSGASGIAHPRIQVACVASSYAGARRLAALVRTAISGYRGTVSGVSIGGMFVENEVDHYNESPDKADSSWTVWIDVVVWHDE
jgi:hypothetical protein